MGKPQDCTTHTPDWQKFQLEITKRSWERNALETTGSLKSFTPVNKAHLNYFCLRTSHQLLPLSFSACSADIKAGLQMPPPISWPSPPCGEGRVPLWFWGHPLARLLLLLWAHLLHEQLLQRRAPAQQDNQQCPAAGASSRHFEASSMSWTFFSFTLAFVCNLRQLATIFFSESPLVSWKHIPFFWGISKHIYVFKCWFLQWI